MRVHYHDVDAGEPVLFLRSYGPGTTAWITFHKVVGGQACSRRAGRWSGRIFPMPKAISAIVTVGNASSASSRTSQAITAGLAPCALSPR